MKYRITTQLDLKKFRRCGIDFNRTPKYIDSNDLSPEDMKKIINEKNLIVVEIENENDSKIKKKLDNELIDNKVIRKKPAKRYKNKTKVIES